MPDAAVISIAAQDEKVDPLARPDIGCGRRGHWTLVGQATLAKGGQWDNKRAETMPKFWKKLVDVDVVPSAILARRIPSRVLDRLRVAWPKSGRGRAVVVATVQSPLCRSSCRLAPSA